MIAPGRRRLQRMLADGERAFEDLLVDGVTLFGLCHAQVLPFGQRPAAQPRAAFTVATICSHLSATLAGLQRLLARSGSGHFRHPVV